MSSLKKEKVYICEICNRKFSRKDILNRHIKSIHEKVQYKCSECSYVTNRKDTLKRHISEVHLNLRLHECQYCGLKFNQSGTLQRHIQSVHSKEENFKCQLCNSSFKRIDNLKRHVECVHENVRKYVCEFCGKSYKLPDHLKQHIISMHTDKRKYVCEECGFAFKLPQHLNDHIRVVHQNHRPHVCEECDAAFPHARDLKLHIIAVHTDEKPFTCEECGRGFADPSHLYRHKQAEACWFTSTTAYKWEELCKEIAEVLLAEYNWVWKPRIDTPELEEQAWIQPEIVVYYENNTKRIIDAKRSTQAIFKEKDLKVYPKVVEKVEFWCLYGKKGVMFEDEPEFDVLTSEEIIKELEKKKTKTNGKKVEKLIKNVSLLKKGINFEGQKILTDFSIIKNT